MNASGLLILATDPLLPETLAEIEELARSCRFADCRHAGEPGCAVLAAEAEGRLSSERLASFRKLQAEAAYQARKSDPRAERAALSTFKSAMKTLRYHHKYRDPDKGST